MKLLHFLLCLSSIDAATLISAATRKTASLRTEPIPKALALPARRRFPRISVAAGKNEPLLVPPVSKQEDFELEDSAPKEDARNEEPPVTRRIAALGLAALITAPTIETLVPPPLRKHLKRKKTPHECHMIADGKNCTEKSSRS